MKKEWHKLFFFAIAMLSYSVLFYYLSFSESAITGHAIIAPTADDIHVTESTDINASLSPYNLQDSNGNGLIIIEADNIYLNCSGSVFLNGRGIAVVINGHKGINITKCTFTSFDIGIQANDTDIIAISNSSINSNSFDVLYTNSTNISESGLIYNNITKRWKIKVNVIDNLSAPLESAKVNLSGDIKNTNLFGSTDYFISTEGNKNISASMAGYYQNSTSVNVNSNGIFSMMLRPLPKVYINSSVYNNSHNEISATLIIYEQGTSTQVATHTKASGEKFENKYVLESFYDLLFSSYNGDLTILLKEINIANNKNKSIGLDSIPVPADSFEKTYSISTDYAFSNAFITMKYNEGGFTNENSLSAYKCSSWNFENRTCTSSWSKIISNVTQNKASNSFEIASQSLSAFKIQQEGFCGDGICNGNETNSSCKADCDIARQNECSDGVIPIEGCLCNGILYDAGYCCYGAYKTDICILNQTSITSPSASASNTSNMTTSQEKTEEAGNTFTIIGIGLLSIIIIGAVVFSVMYLLSNKRPAKKKDEDEIEYELPYSDSYKSNLFKGEAMTPEKVKEILKKIKRDRKE